MQANTHTLRTLFENTESLNKKGVSVVDKQNNGWKTENFSFWEQKNIFWLFLRNWAVKKIKYNDSRVVTLLGRRGGTVVNL